MRSKKLFLHKAVGALVFLIAGFAASSASVAADDHVHNSLAPARPALGYSATGKPDRLDFITFDFRAWLRRDGLWHVEGDVTHRGGLFCADYEMGVRFGVGSPGCTNVEWISEVRYVTSRKQCNDAAIRHMGGDIEPELGSRFDTITCAERVLRCNGNCQEAGPGLFRRDDPRPPDR